MKLPKRIRTMPLEEFRSSAFCGSVTKVGERETGLVLGLGSLTQVATLLWTATVRGLPMIGILTPCPHDIR